MVLIIQVFFFLDDYDDNIFACIEFLLATINIPNMLTKEKLLAAF